MSRSRPDERGRRPVTSFWAVPVGASTTIGGASPVFTGDARGGLGGSDAARSHRHLALHRRERIEEVGVVPFKRQTRRHRRRLGRRSSLVLLASCSSVRWWRRRCGIVFNGTRSRKRSSLSINSKAVPRLKWETVFIDTHMSWCVRPFIAGTGFMLSFLMP